jgi:16S rRNA (adenine1518-N6/adenine1519-N6)-dimethyltransferase
MRHIPRKRFGQNFLQSQHVIDDILREFNPLKTDNVVEIGPGLGALTGPLLNILDSLIAIEIDTDLQALLVNKYNTYSNFKLVNGDALKIDYSQFGDNLRIIGNLPYNISTPLIFCLLGYYKHIEDMHFMLQKEVVERMAATPGCKAYGRLSVVLQYLCEVEELFTVPSTAFHPEPKVESAIVRLIPYKISPFDVVEFSAFESFMAKAFAMRRKTLANNLKTIISAKELTELGIDPTRRPEQISVSEYVQIAKFIAN